MTRTTFHRPCLETLEDRVTPSALPAVMPAPAPTSPVAAAAAPVTAANGLTNDQQFVDSVYNDLLGRDGSISELNFWVDRIPSLGHEGVVRSILNSQETLGNL